MSIYATNAADLARRYVAAGSAPARHFPIAFTPGSRILDTVYGGNASIFPKTLSPQSVC
jgi:hypothetical protein